MSLKNWQLVVPAATIEVSASMGIHRLHGPHLNYRPDPLTKAGRAVLAGIQQAVHLYQIGHLVR